MKASESSTQSGVAIFGLVPKNNIEADSTHDKKNVGVYNFDSYLGGYTGYVLFFKVRDPAASARPRFLASPNLA